MLGCLADKALICGIRLEEIEDPLMQEIRYFDKLVDELSKGKAAIYKAQIVKIFLSPYDRCIGGTKA